MSSDVSTSIVGASEGEVGRDDGKVEGNAVCVGTEEGSTVGKELGNCDGASLGVEGNSVGNVLGSLDGTADGKLDGLGDTDGCGDVFAQHGHHNRYVKVPSDVVTSAVSATDAQPSYKASH